MKKLMLASAFLFSTFAAAPVMAEEPVTKWQWGCEWQQADNGNYWFRVDGGCNIHTALGYASANEMRGKDLPIVTEDNSEDPSDPGDGGTDPGEGPGDDGGNGAEGPGDNGGGNEGPCDEGPSKPGKDRPGKPGKGKGRA